MFCRNGVLVVIYALSGKFSLHKPCLCTLFEIFYIWGGNPLKKFIEPVSSCYNELLTRQKELCKQQLEGGAQSKKR